ncbi:hypothetical protein CEXT_17341, partial [Caerostris extrusa]
STSHRISALIRARGWSPTISLRESTTRTVGRNVLDGTGEKSRQFCHSKIQSRYQNKA